MLIPPVTSSEECKEQFKDIELAMFFKFFTVENQRMDTRMLALENKFDRLLETIDGRMEQLITALVEKPDKLMIPVDVFNKVLCATVFAIFIAMYGDDVVFGLIKEFRLLVLPK